MNHDLVRNVASAFVPLSKIIFKKMQHFHLIITNGLAKTK